MRFREYKRLLIAASIWAVAACSAWGVELSVSDFSFDGQLGSDGATISRLGSNRFEVHLTESPGHPEWSNMCQFTIERNALGNSLRLEGFSAGLRQFGSWSYDGENWNPIQRTTVDGVTTLQFPTFTQDRVYFGGEAPMQYEKMVDLLDGWQQHPHASVHYLGDSLEGRALYRLTVTDPESPFAVEDRWSHHVVNQHCYEYNAQWRIAGMVDWLLSEEGAACRQRSVNHFVVMMNVDGPHNGFARVNTQGIDMNRAYSVTGWEDNPAHESQIVQRDLEQLHASETPITTTFSMHTWSGREVESMVRPGPEMGTTVGAWTELRDILEANDTADEFKLLYELTSTPSPTHWCSGTHLQLGVSAFCVEGAGALFTKEENLHTGAVLMKSLDEFYGDPLGPPPSGSSHYADTLLASGPDVYFRLSESAGRTVGDLLQNDGTLGGSLGATWGLTGHADTAPVSGAAGPNTATRIDGQPLVGLEAANTAARFTGVSVGEADLLDLGNPAALDGEDITFSLWFNSSDANADGSWSRLMTTHPDFDNTFYVVMNEGLFYLATYGDGPAGIDNVAQMVDTTTAYNDGAWHHLVAVRHGDDAGNARLFLDGEEVALSSHEGNFSDGFTFRLGCKGTSTNAFAGSMDEIAVWSRAISDAEASALFEAAFSTGLLPGDLNGDGFVGGDDLDLIRSHWGENVNAGDLQSGDPSGDGFVGGDDLDIVRANWGQGTAPSPNAVPGPSTSVGLLGLLGSLLLARRARKSRIVHRGR